MKASLVIPLYNNSNTLVSQLIACEQVMRRVCSEFEIIISDDNSTDGSVSLLRTHFIANDSFRLYFNKRNQGIAKNVRNLYKKARFPYIVLFSVDGDWNPHDVGRLLIHAQKTDADIVIGKRVKKSYTLYRKLLSTSYNLLALLFFGINTIDTGSIKVIRQELFRKLPLISKSIFFEAEMIIRAKRLERKIESLPIAFEAHNKRKSNGAKVHLILGALKDLVIFRLTG